jgi:predicted DCC family thiol-disulfide oxidoreductase YuxK
MVNRSDTNFKIILFDGVCNFCNYWVNFVLKRDKKNNFKFAALQSEIGKQLLKQFNLTANNFDSFILIDGNLIYKKSEAAFKVAKNLKGYPKVIAILSFMPKKFSDFFYDLIAQNRYKLFGKRGSCRIPTKEEMSKFL